MKKIISVALTLIFCVSFLTVLISADSDAAPEMVVNQTEANAGDEVVVEVSVKNNPGIAMLKIYVKYDSSVLKISEKAVNTGLIGGLFEQSQTTEKNPYVLVWVNTSDSADDGVIATIKFRVSEDAPTCTSAVALEITDAYDISENSVSFNISEGGVSITGNGNSTDKVEKDTASDKKSDLQDQSYEKENNSSVTFVLPDGRAVESVSVDGVTLSQSVYLSENGSEIELLPSYLDTLSEGKHKIVFMFDDGSSASAVLNVVEKSGHTYEIIAVAAVSVAVIVCAVVAIVLTRKGKKSTD